MCSGNQYSIIKEVFVWAEPNEVLHKIIRRPSRGPQKVLGTFGTSEDETDQSGGRRKVSSKKTFNMKKVYGHISLSDFFTGHRDASNKSSHFYWTICRKDVSVPTREHYEIPSPFQGACHYPRDQRLRLETPGWRVLDFFVNP